MTVEDLVTGIEHLSDKDRREDIETFIQIKRIEIEIAIKEIQLAVTYI